ncbi:protein DUF642 L-GALACTONO-1,4-LACTONE-RESPONSIVE GENE 2-like [Salvia miltiorrhiza]|uniref:protein DUF642 L-GALACTONO-1,4-LACTONE-RESPONSIVE GENE 2-like n=1 Tax=Salvia miltiorrhiza TaxID=226208 RepID=UPI0025ABC851|nr:protein DUF642 L-GALACTONO-1,4-LACTONE-RESPONSIVE GENE 2-like [Salvia miltiorrhiza]
MGARGYSFFKSWIRHWPLLFFFFIYITISYATADFLKNPDFEIPPANVTANTSTEANSIPGWSVSGTVWYVASGNSGGHAVQLGQNGKISQRLTATGNYNNALDYIVSFTLAAQNIQCANNRTALNVTLRDYLDRNLSRVIYMLKNSSRNAWERHSFKVPQMGGKDYVDIHIQSVAGYDNDNDTCWPLVDAFTVNTNQMPIWYDGNMLSNGGFEVGPAFGNKSGNGIILNEEDDEFYSPLQQWSVIGSIRYIDSGHYKVPGGRAAVELLSGGVQKDFPSLPTANSYTLNFTVGDANDSCAADLVVHVRVGASVWEFRVKSNGTGSAFRHSVGFRAEASSLVFYSYEETVSGDGALCGPVLDDVILVASFGERLELWRRLLFIAFLIIVIVA